jgi:hypothetical protein
VRDDTETLPPIAGDEVSIVIAHRGSRRGAHAAGRAWDGDRLFVGVTCTRDGLNHRVDERVLTSGVAESGQMQALCGHFVRSGALADPIGPDCGLCEALGG